MDSNICDKLRSGITTDRPAATQAIAQSFAQTLPDDTVLALHGDLGVGKTTFVQGLAQGLGITDLVTSPTFNLFSLYRGPSRRLLHIDAYRVEGEAQMDALLLEDFMISPWIVAIEWPERITDWLPEKTWHLHLGITPDENHTIQLR